MNFFSKSHAQSTSPAQDIVLATQKPAIEPIPKSIDARAEKIKTVIAAGESFDGSMRLRNGVKIDGQVQGEVIFGLDDGMLVLSNSGMIIGDVIGPKAIIQGEVRGNLKITGRVIIMATARITGDIAAGALQVHEGAQIAGRLCPITDLQPNGTLIAGEIARQPDAAAFPYASQQQAQFHQQHPAQVQAGAPGHASVLNFREAATA